MVQQPHVLLAMIQQPHVLLANSYHPILGHWIALSQLGRGKFIPKYIQE